MSSGQLVRSTTVLAIVQNGAIAMASDGQVTVGDAVIKEKALKARKSANHDVLIGFAGGAADALALTERLESKLDEYSGNLRRAAVELAKSWRSDRALRRLEALLLIGNAEHVLVVSGNGDVIEPDDGVAAVGSGGNYALAAARALARHTELTAVEIAEEAIRLAAQICIYTNDEINVVTLP
jgi:ATP-dependent HslUV protease subunit HslV